MTRRRKIPNKLESREKGSAVEAEGARRATVDSTADGDAGGPLMSGQR